MQVYLVSRPLPIQCPVDVRIQEQCESNHPGDKMCTIFLVTILSVSVASKVKDIYWDTAAASRRTEPLALSVQEYDQVNIICPVLKPGTSEGEQHIIYSVEKEEFNNCRITNPKPRIVAICNRPQLSLYFTITFRSFSPTPGGLEFTPGEEYFFISTSSRRDIHRRVGGWCSSHNMKMVVKVEDRNTNYEQEIRKKNKQDPLLHPLLFKLANSKELPQSVLERIIKKYEILNNMIPDTNHRKRQERNLKSFEYYGNMESSSATLVFSSLMIISLSISILFS